MVTHITLLIGINNPIPTPPAGNVVLVCLPISIVINAIVAQLPSEDGPGVVQHCGLAILAGTTGGRAVASTWRWHGSMYEEGWQKAEE